MGRFCNVQSGVHVLLVEVRSWLDCEDMTGKRYLPYWKGEGLDLVVIMPMIGRELVH